MRIVCLLFLVLGTASTGALSADVYTCKENGKTVFQDAPCAFVQDQTAKKHARIVEGVEGTGFAGQVARYRARIKEEEKGLSKEEKHERRMARIEAARRTLSAPPPRGMTCRPSMLGDGALNCE